MNIDIVRDFTLWFIAIAYAILFLGCVIFMLVRKWVPRFFGCRLPEQKPDLNE
jgi:hypothetical protein